MMKFKNKHQGFTLIELAIVLVIIGVVLGGFISTLSSRIEQAKRERTAVQLKEIKRALVGFAISNGRLPCPALPDGNGLEGPNTGSGLCTRNNAFVPAQTLGLTGPYNRDGLLLDSWNNPIRYSISSANANAVTKPDGIKNLPNGMADYTPDLRVCSTSVSAGLNSCASESVTLVDNAPFILLSLGSDGAASTGATAPSGDEGENSREFVFPANAAGENIAYTVGNNRVFVSRGYSETGSVNGKFDDMLVWMSIYELYVYMIDAGQLP